jgi:hypothetical protein
MTLVYKIVMLGWLVHRGVWASTSVLMIATLRQ